MTKDQQEFINSLAMYQLCNLCVDIFHDTAPDAVRRFNLYRAAQLGLDKDNGSSIAVEILMRCHNSKI